MAKLDEKLQNVRAAAPPPAKDSLYAWLYAVYHLRRNIGPLRQEALKLAKKLKITTRDKIIRAIIAVTAGKHMSAKTKWKYKRVLEKALKKKIASKDLREFIESRGGINNAVK